MNDCMTAPSPETEGRACRWLPALSILLLSVLPSACGGRVDSQSAGQAGQAGLGGQGSAGGANDPPCCDPPIVTCFGAGTSIDTPAGPRPIERIEVGELVLGYDEALQAVVARPVTARMQHADAVVGQLVLGDGRAIVTTPDHPFYVAGVGRYRPAQELRPDADLLSLSNNGRLSSATTTGYFLAADPVRMPVFNISVAGVHNYFADGVLVHNKSPPQSCAELSSGPSDLVALTSWEHARSVHVLTGVQIEPVTDRDIRSHYGQMLPATSTYDPDRLDAIAAAAKDGSNGPSVGASCSVGASAPEACALDFIDSFVTRAYRRPLVESERARYLWLFRSALAGSDSATAIRTLTEAALQSPHFLYKVELTDGQLSDYELATRLSYFLNGAPPDAELSAHASAGMLRQRLESEVERLGASPRFVESMRELYAAWLGLDRLTANQVTPGELVQAMRGETAAFFDWQVSADAPVASLLTEPLTFLDAPMAAHYGLPAPASGREPFELDATRYAGALTQASFMTAFSTPTRRGTWILSRLLCTEPPPPPPDVVFPPPPGPGEDLRVWLEQATDNPACRACHQIMDPIGFAFHSFDELGRWRSANDVGSLRLEGTEMKVRGAAALASALLSTRSVLECTMNHWAAWALKRVPDERTECMLGEMASSLSSQMTTRELVKAIARSDFFLDGQSEALDADAPMAPSKPVVPLDTEVARSSAARDLVLQELEALRQKLPKDPGLSYYQRGLQSLAPP